MAGNLTTCKFLPAVFFYDLSFFCSFIVSHPLYFSYFIFFSPYLFRFIFFISPLFLTTSLLLLLSVIATTFPQSKLGFMQTIVDKLRSKFNDVDEDNEFRDFEDFEIYKIVFDGPPLLTVAEGEDRMASMTENAAAVTVTVTKSEEQRRLERLFEELDRFEASTAAIEMSENETRSHLEEAFGELQKLDQKIDENSFSPKLNPCRSGSSSSFGSCGSIGDETTAFEMKENETRSHIEKVVGELLKLEPVKASLPREDKKTVKSNSTASIETKNCETTSHVRKVLQKLEPTAISISGEDKKTVKSNSTAAIETRNSETRSRVLKVLQKSEPTAISISGEDQQFVKKSFSSRSNSWRLDSASSFGSYGSMRKDKEWKRTLACKLFEERNNSEGGEEGMDSLWETYEEDNSSRKSKNNKEAMNNQKKMVMKNKKKSEFKCFVDGEDEEDDDEDEFMTNGQLCCLKALKLSTGKLNLGMGKPNLVKISKALKGFGWLHHVGSKHGKKN